MDNNKVLLLLLLRIKVFMPLFVCTDRLGRQKRQAAGTA